MTKTLHTECSRTVVIQINKTRLIFSANCRERLKRKKDENKEVKEKKIYKIKN